MVASFPSLSFPPCILTSHKTPQHIPLHAVSVKQMLFSTPRDTACASISPPPLPLPSLPLPSRAPTAAAIILMRSIRHSYEAGDHPTTEIGSRTTFVFHCNCLAPCGTVDQQVDPIHITTDPPTHPTFGFPSPQTVGLARTRKHGSVWIEEWRSRHRRGQWWSRLCGPGSFTYLATKNVWTLLSWLPPRLLNKATRLGFYDFHRVDSA